MTRFSVRPVGTAQRAEALGGRDRCQPHGPRPASTRESGPAAAAMGGAGDTVRSRNGERKLGNPTVAYRCSCRQQLCQGARCRVPPRRDLGTPTPKAGPARAAPSGRLPPSCSLTTVQLFGGDGGHRAPLDASRIFTGGGRLCIPRLGVGLEQIRQPQDFTVTVKRVGVQPPDGRKTGRRGVEHTGPGPRTPGPTSRSQCGG